MQHYGNLTYKHYGNLTYKQLQDFKGAQRILNDLASTNSSGTPPSAGLLSSLGRLKLEAGDLVSAADCFEQSASLPSATEQSRDTDSALLAIARGDWANAKELLRGVLEENPDDIIVSGAWSHHCAV